VKRIAHFVGEFLALKHLQTPRKMLLLDALQFYATQHIDWSDALIAAEALVEGLAVYSYDRDLDSVSGLQRIEP
jgi:predicted nucleic acid-binding protein